MPDYHEAAVTIEAEYSSEWDGHFTITTKCKYLPDRQVCTDIEDSGQAPEGQMTDEWVTLPDGRQLRAADGVVFDY